MLIGVVTNNLFVCTQVFKYPVPNDCQSLRYSITPTCIQIGHSFLRRKHCIRDDARPSSRYTLRPLHQALRPMKALIKCMEMNWMAVLVRQSMPFQCICLFVDYAVAPVQKYFFSMRFCLSVQ